MSCEGGNAAMAGADSPRVAVAMLGARRHYAVPRALQQAGMLDRFYTDLCSNVWWLRWLPRISSGRPPRGALGRLMARCVPGVPSHRIRHHPVFKLARTLTQGRLSTPASRLRSYARYNAAFGRMLSARGFGAADTVYVFNAAGLEIAQHARAHAMAVIVDQSAAPWSHDETLLAEERSRWPGWEYEGTRPEDWQPLAEREQGEWAMADLIVCGSSYVVEALRAAGGPVQKAVVVPYGIDTSRFRPVRRDREGALRVLYAGTLQLRKGIPYLMEAARLLKGESIEFRAVGPSGISATAEARLAEVLDLAGPVSRAAMHQEYDRADVLVLPSLSEGAANVCFEALACGLPVITTASAGSVVRDGEDGFIVPVRSPEAIAQRLRELAADRSRLRQMSANAVRRAGEYTFARYAGALAAAVGGVRGAGPRSSTGAQGCRVQ